MLLVSFVGLLCVFHLFAIRLIVASIGQSRLDRRLRIEKKPVSFPILLTQPFLPEEIFLGSCGRYNDNNEASSSSLYSIDTSNADDDHSRDTEFFDVISTATYLF